MPRTVVIVVLLVAVLAGGASLYLLRPAPPPPRPAATWLSSLDIGAVTGIEVTWPGGESVTLAPSIAAPGLWLMEGRSAAWPVQSGRARAALRLLVDAAAGSPQSDEALDAGATMVRVTAGGQSHVVRVRDVGLGGRTLMCVEEPGGPRRWTFLVQSQLAGVFSRESLPSWRDDSAFPGGLADATSMRLEWAGRGVDLIKGMGRWGVGGPNPAPADHEAVAGMLRLLGSIPLRTFPGGDETGTGLDRPTGFISARCDMRTARPDQPPLVRSIVHELRVGGAADASETGRYVSIGAYVEESGARRGLWGPVIAIVDAARLEAVSADPLAYYSRRSAASPGADVTGLVLAARDGLLEPGSAISAHPIGSPSGDPRTARDVNLTRGIDGWRYTPSDGPERALSPGAAAGLAGLVTALCDQAAEQVMTTPPREATSLARLELHGRGGMLEALGVGVAPGPGPGGTALVVRNGSVYRVYTKGAREVIEFLKRELPPEG